MKVQIPPSPWSFGRSRRQVPHPAIKISWSVTFEDNQESIITAISQLLLVIVHAMSSVLLTIDLAFDKNNLKTICSWFVGRFVDCTKRYMQYICRANVVV